MTKNLANEKIHKTKDKTSCWHESLAKIILIVAIYAFLVEKKSLLNNKSTNHKKKKSIKIGTTTFILVSNPTIDESKK